ESLKPKPSTIYTKLFTGPMLPAIVLTGSRWCLLKRPESCTEKQAVKLKELVAINLKTVRAYIRSSVLSATADLLCLSRL
ncbi:MAG: transposase, partial [Deltaproteobacteria bacterium]